MNECMRASGASENFSVFTFKNYTISFNILLVLTCMILCLRNIYFQVSKYICIHTINAVSFYYLWHGAICDIIIIKHYSLRKLYEYASASGASENFSVFTFKNYYFLQYSVGYCMILCLRNIYFQVSKYICMLTYNQLMQFPFISYGMEAIYDSIIIKHYSLRRNLDEFASERRERKF